MAGVLNPATRFDMAGLSREEARRRRQNRAGRRCLGRPRRGGLAIPARSGRKATATSSLPYLRNHWSARQFVMADGPAGTRERLIVPRSRGEPSVPWPDRPAEKDSEADGAGGIRETLYFSGGRTGGSIAKRHRRLRLSLRLLFLLRFTRIFLLWLVSAYVLVQRMVEADTRGTSATRFSTHPGPHCPIARSGGCS
jgi:hypothetical protein